MTKYSGRIVIFRDSEGKPVYVGKTVNSRKKYHNGIKAQAKTNLKNEKKLTKIQKHIFEYTSHTYVKISGDQENVSFIHDLIMDKIGSYENGCNKKHATRSGKVY